MSEIFLWRLEYPLSTWLNATNTSLSDIANTLSMIFLLLSPEKLQNRVITLVGSGENLQSFRVTVTFMVPV
jgi:hypothetical protein